MGPKLRYPTVLAAQHKHMQHTSAKLTSERLLRNRQAITKRSTVFNTVLQQWNSNARAMQAAVAAKAALAARTLCSIFTATHSAPNEKHIKKISKYREHIVIHGHVHTCCHVHGAVCAQVATMGLVYLAHDTRGKLFNKY